MATLEGGPEQAGGQLEQRRAAAASAGVLTVLLSRVDDAHVVLVVRCKVHFGANRRRAAVLGVPGRVYRLVRRVV